MIPCECGLISSHSVSSLAGHLRPLVLVIRLSESFVLCSVIGPAPNPQPVGLGTVLLVSSL